MKILVTGGAGFVGTNLIKQLLEDGHKKQKLRAHSNFYWNTAVNEWALSFNDQFDIMCEAKGKNIASFELYKHATR